MTYSVAPEQSDSENPSTNIFRNGELILWIAGLPCCMVLLTLVKSFSLPEITANADILVAVSIGGLACSVVIWNLLNVIVARLSTCAALPHRIRNWVLHAISLAGTQRAKRIVIRHAAGIGLSSIGLLGMHASAFSTPVNSEAPEVTIVVNEPTIPVDLSLHPRSSEPVRQGISAPPLERTPKAQQPSQETRRKHTVDAGECLWTIAQSMLPTAANNLDISQLTRRIYLHNKHTIGSDPNVIHPGQELDLNLGDEQ